MVKLIFFCRRRADITHEQYVERLLAGHVPIALRHHPTLRRYVVNIVEDSPPGWDELDSIGELWFDHLDDFRERLYDSVEGRRVVEQDVAGFMGSADAYVTTEHVQRAPLTPPALGTRAPGITLICPLLRRPDLTHAGFVAHWLHHHAALALRHHSGMVAYVTNVVDRHLPRSQPALDGIAQLTFPSVRALRDAMFDSADGERIIRTDMARFIGRTAAYRAAAYVQKT